MPKTLDILTSLTEKLLLQLRQQRYHVGRQGLRHDRKREGDNQEATRIPPDQQRLFHCKVALEDSTTLADYDVQHGPKLQPSATGCRKGKGKGIGGAGGAG